jgi:DNA-directed RNA polymerase specialized sigma24 family protein
MQSEGEYQSFFEALSEFLAGRESVRVVLAHAEFQTRLKLICGGITKEQQKTADLVQNTCLRLLKYEKTIRQNNPANADQFFSLVFKVAQNIHFDSGKKNRLLLEETPVEDIPISGNGLDPEEESLLNEFERFIQSLSSEHQRAFALEWEGYSYRAIAEILRVEGHVCTHVTVRTWISNGLRDFTKRARVKKASGF